MTNERFSKSFKQAADINEAFSWKDIGSLGVPFWLTCLSCFCTYVAVVNSIFMGSSVLQTRFGFSIDMAGLLFTMPYIVSAILSPFMGWFVDKYGYRLTMCNLGAAVMLFAHIIQPCIPDCDQCWYSTIPLMLQGFSYTTYAVVLWGAFPYLVEARFLGIAFGICTTA